LAIRYWLFPFLTQYDKKGGIARVQSDIAGAVRPIFRQFGFNPLHLP